MAFKRSSVRSRYPPLHNPLQNKGLCRFLMVPHWWVMGLALLLHHIYTTFRSQFHVSYMFDRWDTANLSRGTPPRDTAPMPPGKWPRDAFTTLPRRPEDPQDAREGTHKSSTGAAATTTTMTPRRLPRRPPMRRCPCPAKAVRRRTGAVNGLRVRRTAASTPRIGESGG